jgi:hypothetical protein
LEVLKSAGLILEDVQHPVKKDLTEPSTVLVTESTTVADVNVALPGGNTAWYVLIITLSLFTMVSKASPR